MLESTRASWSRLSFASRSPGMAGSLGLRREQAGEDGPEPGRLLDQLRPDHGVAAVAAYPR
jgi:hypothetical protein